MQKGGSSVEKGRHASFITQCSVLTRRSFVNMYRDLGYYWLRLAIYIALCLCVGTIYYDIGVSYSSIQVIDEHVFIGGLRFQYLQFI